VRGEEKPPTISNNRNSSISFLPHVIRSHFLSDFSGERNYEHKRAKRMRTESTSISDISLQCRFTNKMFAAKF
jgi:hypothetical protein